MAVNNVKEFATHDVDLAAFLMLHGLKFIESTPDTSGPKPRALMRFFDEKEIARDLEQTFMKSEFKVYRDYQKYLLRDIHRTLQRTPQKGI